MCLGGDSAEIGDAVVESVMDRLNLVGGRRLEEWICSNLDGG